MKKEKTEHCVMITGGVQCRHCGDIHKMPIPIAIRDMTKLLDDFSKRHQKCKPAWEQPVIDARYPIAERIRFWLNNGELGSSSVAIYNAFIPGYKLFGWDDKAVPQDADDFRRCYLLLKIIPEWKERLVIMKGVSQAWANLVDNWDQLTAMLEEGMKGNDAKWKVANEFIKNLIKE